MKNLLQKAKSLFLSALLKIKGIPSLPFVEKSVQTVSAMWKEVKVFLKTSPDFIPPSKEKVVSFVLKWWHWMLGGVFAFLVLYYPAGAVLTHQIDDNPSFMEKRINDNAPKTVQTLYSLINREINVHVWTPNLPFFFPSAVLDNMPAYQTGEINAVRETVKTLSEVNPDVAELKSAAERLSVSPTAWYLSGLKPSVSANSQYQKARTELMTYEKAVENASDVFNTDKSALRALLTAMADVLDGNTDKIARQVAKYEKRPFDSRADNVFYQAKGNTYVVYLMLRDAKDDFKSEFENEKLRRLRQDALDSLTKVLNIRPFLITNGGTETQFVPNHLLNAGFYISKAEADIREMLILLNK